MAAMPDACFDDPRLAAVYDALEGDRADLAAYVAIADELGARSVLDIGCGTGTLAGLLAATGREVTGVDPAAASLDVARAKPFADRVRWLLGDAATLPPLRVDLATMTGNVAQVFLGDDDLAAALSSARASLRPGGHVVFEVRDPAFEGWQEWTPERSRRRIEVPGVGGVETWVELTDVRLPFVSFRWTYVFAADGSILASDSTLRFRQRAEIVEQLQALDLRVVDVRDAPDRPGRELVFIARRPPA